MFFIFCLFFPRSGSKEIKQPLKILLSVIVVCAAILQIFFLQKMVMGSSALYTTLYRIINIILKDLVEISMTTTMWLNVFYFSQIVPAEKGPLKWLKTNIKLFIYCALIFDWAFLLSNGLFDIVSHVKSAQNANNATANATHAVNKQAQGDSTAIGLFVCEISYLLLCLFVMMMTSVATVSYLRAHMKTVKDSDLSSSLRSQARVTITGIIQTVLYSVCNAWIISYMIKTTFFETTFDKKSHVFYTIISIYSLGTALNLAVGQSVFRVRAAELWRKVSTKK